MGNAPYKSYPTSASTAPLFHKIAKNLKKFPKTP